MTLKPFSAFLTLALAVPTGSVFAQTGQSAFDFSNMNLPREWSERLAPEVYNGIDFRVYARRMVTAGNTDGGPFVAVFALAPEGGIVDEWNYAPTEGLSSTFTISALDILWTSQTILLGGVENELPALYHASITAAGEVGEWSKLPDFPEQHEEHIRHILSDGNDFVVLTDRGEPSRLLQSGWSATFSKTPGEDFWTQIPTPEFSRSGYGAAAVRNRAYLIGGVVSGSGSDLDGKPRLFLDTLSFGGQALSIWQTTAPGISRPVNDAVATSHGMVTYVGPRTSPQTDGTQQQRNLVLMQTGDIGDGKLGLWRQVTLEQAPADIRSLVIDPAASQLLVITDDKGRRDLVVTAYQLSTSMVSRRMTEEELLVENLRRVAVSVPDTPLEEFEEQIQSRKLGLYVLSTGGDAEDVLVRASFGRTAVRYMMASVPIAYYKGAAAEKIGAQFGVTATPAYILVNDTGTVLERHEGSIATPEQVFRLTAPGRAPQDQTAPAATSAE